MQHTCNSTTHLQLSLHIAVNDVYIAATGAAHCRKQQHSIHGCNSPAQLTDIWLQQVLHIVASNSVFERHLLEKGPVVF